MNFAMMGEDLNNQESIMEAIEVLLHIESNLRDMIKSADDKAKLSFLIASIFPSVIALPNMHMINVGSFSEFLIPFLQAMFLLFIGLSMILSLLVIIPRGKMFKDNTMKSYNPFFYGDLIKNRDLSLLKRIKDDLYSNNGKWTFDRLAWEIGDLSKIVDKKLRYTKWTYGFLALGVILSILYKLM